jgi:predicted transcriptional regulator
MTKGSPVESEAVAEAMKGLIRALGWGIIGMSLDRQFYIVKLLYPPIDESLEKSHAGGSYVQGLIAGLLESKDKLATPLSVTHEAYEKEKRVLTIYYGTTATGETKTSSNQTEEVLLSPGEAIEMESEIGQVPDHDRNHAQNFENRLPPLAISYSAPPGPAAAAPPPEYVSTRPNTFASSSCANPIPLNLGDLSTVKKILAAARGGILKVNLMHCARITMSQANEYLQNLLKADLLEARRVPQVDSVMYYTTEKGIDYLEVHEKLEHMLDEDRSGTKVIRTALR